MFNWQRFIVAILIFLIGGLGGVFGDRILFPYLAGKPFFSKFDFIRESARGTTIINREEKVIIRENQVLEDLIPRVSPQVVVLRALDKKDSVLAEGGGFILTNDGLILGPDSLMLGKAKLEVIIDGRSFQPRIRVRNSKEGIAVFKIDEANLQAVNLEEPDKVRLGESVFLLAKKMGKEEIILFLNAGTVTETSPNKISTNILTEDLSANGSPLFNLEGKIIGANLVSKDGALKTVSVTKIRELLSEALR